MKRFLIPVILAVLAIGIGWHFVRKRENTVPEVSLRNPIPPITTGQTPLFVARDKGFFEELGLSVKLEQGGAEVNPVKMVAAGKNTFGIVGGPEILLVAKGQGIPVKAIAILHRNANFPCFVTLEPSGITEISQLQDKKVAFFPGHITTDVLKPLLKKEGVKINESSMGLDYTQLITSKIDAQWAFTVRAAIQLPLEGHPVNVIRASDYGVITHGYTIFALEETIESRPEICEKILRGIFQGIDTTLEHPEEAESILLSANPTLADDLEFVRKSESMFNAVISNSEEFPKGYMDSGMFESAYKYLKEEGAIENDFPVKEAFTTQFLEKIHGRKFE
ncbi:MAG: hypothetical protein CMO55_17025 [Verrucomicrobiales bacterium]|nr:hypothetical protein [Verrucomicrobiales bacterium]